MDQEPIRTHRPAWVAIAAGVVLVAILGTFTLLMLRLASEIRDGNRAVVCILAIDLPDRPAAVDACLRENGL